MEIPEKILDFVSKPAAQGIGNLIFGCFRETKIYKWKGNPKSMPKTPAGVQYSGKRSPNPSCGVT